MASKEPEYTFPTNQRKNIFVGETVSSRRNAVTCTGGMREVGSRFTSCVCMQRPAERELVKDVISETQNLRRPSKF